MPGPEPARHAVVVLAAGRGRRMGGPKALMLVRGEPWWRLQQRRLLDAGCAPVWVVSPEVDEALRGEPDAPPAITTGDPDAPMFASLVRGMSRVPRSPRPPRVFVLPVDVPAPRPDVWETLAAAGAGVAVPTFEGRRGHPVCLAGAWVDRVLHAAPTARLDRLVAGVATDISVSDACVATNLNTPSDVDRWLASAG